MGVAATAPAARSIGIASLVVAMLMAGCSLAPRPATNPGTSTPPRAAGGPPTAAIGAPGAGVFGWVGHPIDVDARGADPWGIGVTRLELSVAGTVVDSISTAGNTAQLTFAAILQWIPTAEGNYALSVRAFRSDGTASAPAGVTIGIMPALGTPRPTPVELPTDDPGPSEEPTFVPLSPEPGDSPTPAPTAAPIRIDLAVALYYDELPAEWVVGKEVEVLVHVSNLGDRTVASFNVKLTAARGQATRKVEGLQSGQTRTLRIKVTPAAAGSRTLKAEAVVPKGYSDYDPANNVWTLAIQVQPAPTPTPGPTAAPTAAPTEAPTPSPTPEPEGTPGDS